MFIKKIFESQVDESVHKQFVRFGKGRFEGRAIINVKKNSVVKISTSFELANDLVAFVADLAKWFRVQGIILSKQPLEGLKGKKKKEGIFSYPIAKELSCEELKEIASTSYAALLDCLSPEGKIDLRIKKRFPRLLKLSSGEIRIDDKFCRLSLDALYWKEFHDEFLFDLPRELKKARIEHSYIIDKIIMPKETKGKDFKQIRQEARKKGKLIRKATVDGRKFLKETAFVV